MALYNKNLKKTSHIITVIVLFILCLFSIGTKAEENIQDLEIIETSDEGEMVSSENLLKEVDKIEVPTHTELLELKGYGSGKIIVLNKVTAKSSELVLKLGEPQYFGNIQITLHKCVKNLDPYNEDIHMLLTVTEHKIDEDPIFLFQGWVFSSSISLSSFEHPIYEIFAQNCF